MAEGNCLACHGANIPAVLNHRGDWLLSEKGRRNAKECDMAWLKDYKEPVAPKAPPKAPPAKPGAKPAPKPETIQLRPEALAAAQAVRACPPRPARAAWPPTTSARSPRPGCAPRSEPTSCSTSVPIPRPSASTGAASPAWCERRPSATARPWPSRSWTCGSRRPTSCAVSGPTWPSRTRSTSTRPPPTADLDRARDGERRAPFLPGTPRAPRRDRRGRGRGPASRPSAWRSAPSRSRPSCSPTRSPRWPWPAAA